MSRCFSQFIDLCLSGANVKIIGFFSGLTTFGMVQQSMHIFNIVKSIPNCKILQPSSTKEFELMLAYSAKTNGPVIIFVPTFELKCNVSNLGSVITGKGITLKSGDKMTVLPIGSGAFSWISDIALELPKIEIINPRFLKPFDIELLISSIEKTRKLLVLEDGYKTSGFGGELIYSVKKIYNNFDSEWIGYEEKFLCGQNYVESQNYLGCSREKIISIAMSLYNA
ncbi:transketolase, pyrimidine binding domain protein [Rickettsia argasii T170-B]|uniref:Transketolase, pyrimidine binding domain protein n=2 Tax=Rickettsia argasii TaxID=1441385 RepID=A0A0F3RE41_9RICK|nr:transketolase, pyrimidine binding domain protein [Rickettsia argasii T170-B]